MEIIQVSRNIEVMWQMHISIFSGGSNFNYFSKMLSFLHSFLSPCTCVKVTSFLEEEVSRNLHELERSTTTQENYGVTLRNIKQFLYQGFSLVNYWLEILCTVTNLHQRKTSTIEIQNLLCCVLNHFAWKH